MARLTVTDARANLAEALNRVAYGKERLVVRRRGKDLAAMIPVEDLRLLEELEDRADARAARKALAEPGGKPLKEIRRRLGV
ncbi:MAG: type II toxin-antitoxin system Phd/YefM family antitoxin [Planctomycetes bacterium]|nr:type II toxin-antitoxin system Phd/YefM family antitoxin [Planctomycetota bacterium]